MRERGIFIAGTDTEVGKTVVSGLLARHLLDKGYDVVTQKWIQTGSEGFPEDIDVHLKFMGRKRVEIDSYLNHIAPYVFKFPSSPHLAASLEKRKIRINKIKESFNLLSKKFDIVIVDGIGGVLVPVNRKKLLIDIVKELELPVLIVVKNKLGAINHTLMTVEAIRARNIKILGIIFNRQNKKEDETILKDNPKIIKAISSENILGNLSWEKDKKKLCESFVPIGDEIIRKLAK